MKPEEYFKEGMRVMLSLPLTDRGTPKILQHNIGKEVDANDLRKSYPKEVAIKVNNNCVLEEITSCWTRRKDTGKPLVV